MNITNRLIRISLFLGLLLSFTFPAYAVKGIYLTQYSLENTAFLKNTIQRAKAAGIDTFVVDMEFLSKRYGENIALVKEAGIKYVARIIMFPGGAKPGELLSRVVWDKKWSLVQQAINHGASEIQLDYIRYSSKQKPSPQNARDVLEVIAWFHNKLSEQKIPLQIDVFGVTSFGESKYIGQNIKMFADNVNAICPMVYPSHYAPYQYYSARPYGTILDSLQRIKKQFGGQMPIKLIPYIEMTNYHYLNMANDKKIAYIKAQIRATQEAGADGWYAWSAHNRYDNLFAILEKDPSDDKKAVADANYSEPSFGAKSLAEHTNVNKTKTDNKQSDKPAKKNVAEDSKPAEQPAEEPKKSNKFSWFQRRYSF